MSDNTQSIKFDNCKVELLYGFTEFSNKAVREQVEVLARLLDSQRNTGVLFESVSIVLRGNVSGKIQMYDFFAKAMAVNRYMGTRVQEIHDLLAVTGRDVLVRNEFGTPEAPQDNYYRLALHYTAFDAIAEITAGPEGKDSVENDACFTSNAKVGDLMYFNPNLRFEALFNCPLYSTSERYNAALQKNV